MIAPDANLLIYAYNDQARAHRAAREWWESALGGTEAVGIPMLSVAAFIRIITDRRLQGRVMTTKEATSAVNAWLDYRHVRLLHAGEQHWGLLRELLLNFHIAGPVVTDAQIAAVAIEHGATLYTEDRDFDRFHGVRVVHPLRVHRA